MLLLLGLLSITARPATDPDLWWHLRTGQWIVETGHIPHTDPFSFTRAGQPWVAHEWLSEVILYEFWKHLGAAGLIVFAALITAAGFMLLYRRCPGKPHWAAAATVLGALASASAWGVRPQMFTFALASLLLWLLETGQQRPWRLLWIPPLFLLWLNLHAGFALAPALLAAFGVGWLWEVAAGETPWREARPILSRLLWLLVACLALVPFNPSGAQLYRYPLDVLHSGGMRSFIVEWLSPDFHQSRYWPFLLICLSLTIACASSRMRPKARVIVPLLGTFLAALDAVRHIPIFVLLAVPVIAAALPDASFSWQFGPDRLAPARHTSRLPFHAAILILMAGFAAVRWQTLVGHQAASEAELFPQQAVESLRSEGAGSTLRLFAYYDWGGYAIWKLYPRERVFVDGRADLYGNDLIDQFKTAIELRHGWQKVLDQQGVEAALIPTSSPLAQALALQADWVIKYRDPKATVFLRIIPATGGTENTKESPRPGKLVKKSYRSPPESAKLGSIEFVLPAQNLWIEICNRPPARCGEAASRCWPPRISVGVGQSSGGTESSPGTRTQMEDHRNEGSGEKIVAKRRRSGHCRVRGHAGRDSGDRDWNHPSDRRQCEQRVLLGCQQHFAIDGGTI